MKILLCVVAGALGKIGDKAAVSALVEALKDEDSAVRKGAAEALRNIGNEAAVPALMQALREEDIFVPCMAAQALAKIGDKAAVPALVQALYHKQSLVRMNAAVALGEIDNEAAVPVLVQALSDENSLVRSRVAVALGDIASSELLPTLSELLITTGESYLLNTIAAIQERYKYYNYTLTQPETPLRPPSISLMHILHLSDLHFGTPDQAKLWSNQLASDLQNELDISQLDALILSGDIANKSTPAEYEAAQQFIYNLYQEFTLKSEKIIIVPGNHDLNWSLAKKGYQLFDRDEYEGQLKPGEYIEESASVIRVRDEEKYKQRFEHFRNFYQIIKTQPYPLDYDQQYTLDHFPNQNLLILGLNSAWQLDHHYKSRASINMNALSNALTEIRRNQDYKNCLKIAVWHHPLDSAWEDRIKDQSFMEQLAVAGFRLFLHGHVHKAETNLYRYDMSAIGRKLDRICAGTFGAPTQELNPGYPWQYNLLKISENNLTVYTRRREELNGAWKPDARWLMGAGQNPLPYYEISL